MIPSVKKTYDPLSSNFQPWLVRSAMSRVMAIYGSRISVHLYIDRRAVLVQLLLIFDSLPFPGISRSGC